VKLISLIQQQAKGYKLDRGSTLKLFFEMPTAERWLGRVEKNSGRLKPTG